MGNEDYSSQQPRTQRMPAQHARQSQQQQQQQPQYQQQQYATYQPAQYRPMRMQQADITTTGQWVLTLFLACIPLIGLILMFVWAFGSNTPPSKKNWARANLVWLLIAIILSVAVAVVAVFLGFPLQDYMQDYWQRYLTLFR